MLTESHAATVALAARGTSLIETWENLFPEALKGRGFIIVY